jgi:hypothetical protein
MDNKKIVVRQIEALDEDELATDLKFIYNNRADTADLFIDEIIPVMKYHIARVMENYQDRLMNSLTNSLQGEIAGIILRTRRDTIFTQPKIESKTEESKAKGRGGSFD